MKEPLKIFQALSDESRVRLLFALRHREWCVCQLIALLELAPSTVSKHLSLLRDAGLINARKEGRWVYYRLAEQTALPLFGSEAAPLFQRLERNARIKADDRKLKRIGREGVEALCRRLAS